MKIQIIQTNELEVFDSQNEHQAIEHLKNKYYEECSNNPDTVTKEIRIINTTELKP